MTGGGDTACRTGALRLLLPARLGRERCRLGPGCGAAGASCGPGGYGEGTQGCDRSLLSHPLALSSPQLGQGG